MKTNKTSLLLAFFCIASSGFTHEILTTGGAVGSDVDATATDISESDLIATAGRFYDTVDFSGTTLTSIGAAQDIYLTVGRPGETPLATSITGNDSGVFDSFGDPVRVLLSGDYVYLVGHLQGPIEYAPGAILSNPVPAFTNTFVIKYAIKEDGLSAEWGITFRGTQPNRPHDAAIDGNGVLWVVGYFEGTTNFDPSGAPIGNLTSNGLYDGFTARLNPDGTSADAPRKLGGTGFDEIKAIVFDDNNYSFIGGYFNGTANVDVLAAKPAASLTSAGGNNGFVVRRTPAEEFISLEHFSTSDNAEVRTLALRGFDDLIIGGEFTAPELSASTPGFTLIGGGATDAFIARRQSGALTYITSISGSGHGFVNRIVANKSIITVAGSFVLQTDFGNGEIIRNTPGDFDGYLWTLTDTLETEAFRHISGTQNAEVRDAALKENGWISAVGSYRSDTEFRNGASVISKPSTFDSDYFQWFCYPAPLPQVAITPFGTTGIVLSFLPRCAHDYLIEESADLTTWSPSGAAFTGGTSTINTLKEYPPPGPATHFFYRLHALTTTERLALP
jgi:hypothetical protein